MSSPNNQAGAGWSENPYEPPRTVINPSQTSKQGGWLDRDKSGQLRTAPAAEFMLDCPCGRTITVAASQAGSTATCVCRAEIRVPSLSKLRESSGKSPYESSICDMIRRMVGTGELPGRSVCAVSKKPTDDVIEIQIIMPRIYKSEDESNNMMLLLLGVWSLVYVAFITLMGRQKFHEDGATTVQVPLRVDRRYHAKVRRMKQSRLRRLLRTVPMYARLLDDHPDSRIRAEYVAQ